MYYISICIYTNTIGIHICVCVCVLHHVCIFIKPWFFNVAIPAQWLLPSLFGHGPCSTSDTCSNVPRVHESPSVAFLRERRPLAVASTTIAKQSTASMTIRINQNEKVSTDVVWLCYDDTSSPLRHAKALLKGRRYKQCSCCEPGEDLDMSESCPIPGGLTNRAEMLKPGFFTSTKLPSGWGLPCKHCRISWMECQSPRFDSWNWTPNVCVDMRVQHFAKMYIPNYPKQIANSCTNQNVGLALPSLHPVRYSVS